MKEPAIIYAEVVYVRRPMELLTSVCCTAVQSPAKIIESFRVI